MPHNLSFACCLIYITLEDSTLWKILHDDANDDDVPSDDERILDSSYAYIGTDNNLVGVQLINKGQTYKLKVNDQFRH